MTEQLLLVAAHFQQNATLEKHDQNYVSALGLIPSLSVNSYSTFYINSQFKVASKVVSWQVQAMLSSTLSWIGWV